MNFKKGDKMSENQSEKGVNLSKNSAQNSQENEVDFQGENAENSQNATPNSNENSPNLTSLNSKDFSEKNMEKNMDLNNIKSIDLSDPQTLKFIIERIFSLDANFKGLKKDFNDLKRMFSETIEIIPSAIWVLDKDRKILLQNHQAKENRHLLKHINTGVEQAELEFRGRFYAVKVARQRSNFIVQATDISDEKRNERLVSMGSVAAHLAHEIRNPIGALSLLTSTLFAKVELKNKYIVLEMQKAIARVERIITSTLLFTKGVELSKSEFSLAELKDECEQAVNSYSFESKIAFEFDFADIKITADKALLGLVLQNLIYNAIDAIEEKDAGVGKVCVRGGLASVGKNGGASNKGLKNGGALGLGSVLKDEIRVSVSDDGAKIADESVVFEAFKTTKFKGSGLGMSLSKRIINAHGGELKFTSKPKEFYFTLPLTDEI